ncbi:MAG: ATP-binding protein [Bacillota bacterium]|jgi:NAD-dependent dihydropyrimidine dehydrogenase PreA subunit
MKRKIVKIDEEKCTGCGLCINACHEGALQLVNGKAKLITDSYCDGLGACLPACPVDAIHIEEREADAFDEEAVKQRMQGNNADSGTGGGASANSDDSANSPGNGNSGNASAAPTLPCGCPGSQARMINRSAASGAAANAHANAQHGSAANGVSVPAAAVAPQSQLRQWPVQIQLVPVNAPYLEDAHLLVAADCTAYAYANIHNDFMRGKITLIGCPKLDDANYYAEKFTEVLKNHNIKSITILRMQVPCCGGIVHAVKTAMINSGKMIPWRVVIIDTEGNIVED